MAAIDQLWLYKEAIRICQARTITALSDASEIKLLLDDVYGGNGIFLNSVLEAGQWSFANRTSQFDYSPSVEPPFGYQFAFNKPTDWVRTNAMCSDQYFRTPLNEMAEEAGFWFADLQTIYVKYVSNDPDYGANYALWPASFSAYAGAWLARQVIPRVKNSKVTTDDVQKELDARLKLALSKDAMNQPTKFTPPGSFTAARIGRGNPRQSLWNGTFIP